MSAVVAVQSLAKRFKDKEVLRGVDLEVREGEVVGLLGPNGSGKSTLLRMLVGLVFRDSGSMLVHGLDPATRSLGVRRRTAYLPGETAVYAGMSGREFLEFALGFYERRDEDLRQGLLDEFELPLERKVRSYSAGMKQKLALLATLVPDVDLYLLDEPDRALDATARKGLCDRLRALAARGKTILLSSHHLAEVESLASRLVFLIDGRPIPGEVVSEVRADLCRELRLRLSQGTPLPPGVLDERREQDGSLRIRTAGDPLVWAATIPTGRILALEVGATRLDVLFEALAKRALR